MENNQNKKISIIIPCYNEENSIAELYNRIYKVMHEQLSQYDYECIFVDDYSKDNTRIEIRKLCQKDEKVKAVFNAKNFGFHRNVFECFKYASGDCAFLIFGDLQDPPEVLPQFIQKWEEGYKCIVGQRNKSEEGFAMRQCRKLYYFIINQLGEKKQIPFMNGFGVYDRFFIDTIIQIEDISPFFKAVVSEYGMDLAVVEYNHCASKRGKSNFNFWRNYDFAMHGLTTSTKLLMRLCTFLGVFVAFLCMIFAVYVFIKKIIFWDSYPLGTASLTVGVFFLGAIQLFFIGVLGEYILNINEKATKKPRVVVEKKINFDESTINDMH